MARPLPANLVNLIGDRAHLANLALPSRTTTSTPIHPIHENIKLGKLDKIMEIIQSEPTAIDCRNKVIKYICIYKFIFYPILINLFYE